MTIPSEGGGWTKPFPGSLLGEEKDYRLQTSWTFLWRNHHHQLHGKPVAPTHLTQREEGADPAAVGCQMGGDTKWAAAGGAALGEAGTVLLLGATAHPPEA